MVYNQLSFSKQNSQKSIRLELNSADQKANPIMVVAGAPGTGKSRLLVEYPALLRGDLSPLSQIHHVDLFTTYGNGSHFSQDEISMGIEESFSLRVLAAYFGIEFNVVLTKFKLSKIRLTLYETLNAIKTLEKKDQIGIYLSIDEFQRLLGETGSDQEKRGNLKKLVRAIGSIQCSPPKGVFVVSLIGGTLLTPLQKAISMDSAYPTMQINIPLIHHTSDIQNIVDTTGAKVFSENHHFQTALLYIGGWPRALDEKSIDSSTINQEYQKVKGSVKDWKGLTIPKEARVIQYLCTVLPCEYAPQCKDYIVISANNHFSHFGSIFSQVIPQYAASFTTPWVTFTTSTTDRRITESTEDDAMTTDEDYDMKEEEE
ncbi:hypothetical protein DFA_06174 [Cavenderia fasciculata]|uniref:Uncharacterized protein n=1 Tax=Cavenderia fasciculata TaxID=261658 RepID=F4PKB2_CACFS|nr:uncharacterized protein DFA_06174 [Cavenderia fasciculata]EGG24036.1 hypothetical protein DFA_06174 [Cavenderia fasciculata]|eukprot:XP_004361887.1 hypothetical protein DFA_06174 [Cavenderia fasciculata]